VGLTSFGAAADPRFQIQSRLKSSGRQSSGFFSWTHPGVCKGFYRVFESSRIGVREVSALFDWAKFESFDLLVKNVHVTLKR